MDKHIEVLEELAARLDGYEQRSACMAHWNTQSGQRDDADYWSQHAKDMNLAAHELRAAIALMRGQSWQPIETAPKDGSYVLVANSHGSWIAKWHPVYQSGYRPSNPWASMMLNHDHIEKPGRFDKPTHWQPLPAPPQQEPADEP